MNIKDDLLTDAQVAEIIGYKRSTLIKNRCLGRNHPPFIKIGRYVLYPKKEVLNWLKSRPLNCEISQDEG
jgi:predicted DNA-binding transcriptional regulator AlpA